MRLSTTAFAVAALVSTGLSSFLIPADLPEGIWTGSLDDGEDMATLTKIGDIGASSVPDGTAVTVTQLDKASSAVKRDTTGCTDHVLDPLHNFVAYNHAWDACPWQTNIPGRTFTVWYANDVFWFVCNYRYTSYSCSRNDLDITLSSIKWSCGDNRSGWDYLSTPDVSWGNENIGYGIC